MVRPISTTLLAIACASLLACNRAPSTAEPKETSAANSAMPELEPLPEISKESPDSVVRSYWALMDWSVRNTPKGLRVNMASGVREYSVARMALGGGEFAAVNEQQDRMMETFFENGSPERIQQRDILEVKSESETRAVVTTKMKNITPLPPNYELPEFWKKRRDFGQEVRYIVEKIKGEWRLTQAWYRDNPDDAEWQKAWEVKPPSTGPNPFTYYYTDR
jgi:hypothetical protein